jgi:hypothetical protein
MSSCSPLHQKRFSDKEDSILTGLLLLLTTLVKRDNSLKPIGTEKGHDLVTYVFNHCLFDIPTFDNHGAEAPPKCKTKRARKAAFKLLVELARDCVPNFLLLTSLLFQQNKLGQ